MVIYFIDAQALKGQKIGHTGSHVFFVCDVVRSLTFQQIASLPAILSLSSNRRRAPIRWYLTLNNSMLNKRCFLQRTFISLVHAYAERTQV